MKISHPLTEINNVTNVNNRNIFTYIFPISKVTSGVFTNKMKKIYVHNCLHTYIRTICKQSDSVT